MMQPLAAILIDVGRAVRRLHRHGGRSYDDLDPVFQQVAIDWIDFSDICPGIVFRAIVENWDQSAIMGAMGLKIDEVNRQ